MGTEGLKLVLVYYLAQSFGNQLQNFNNETQITFFISIMFISLYSLRIVNITPAYLHDGPSENTSKSVVSVILFSNSTNFAKSNNRKLKSNDITKL